MWADSLARRALAINPKHAPALNNSGVALDAKADHKKALDAFKRATVADPTYAEAWFNLGLSYFNTNEQGKATKAFEQALTPFLAAALKGDN